MRATVVATIATLALIVWPASTRAQSAASDSVRITAPDTASVAAAADTSAADTARAYDLRTRKGRWAVGPLAGSGWPQADDFNQRLDFENLAFASDLPHLEDYWIVGAAMRYGLSERLAFDIRGQYLWKTLDAGRIERRVSAIPIVAGVTAHLWRVAGFRIGPYAGGGFLYDATVSGEDPLGGLDVTGNGWLAEAGVEAEYPLFGPSGTIRARGGGQLARASDLLGQDVDFDLDGWVVQFGIFYYLRP